MPPDPTQLQDKVALVSGGARGIGGATAALLAERGARVVIADVLDDLGKESAAAIGESALFVHLDVCEELEWVAAVALAEERFGKLDALVNAAGISPPPQPIAETSLEDYLRVVQVNQVGTFLGLKCAIPALVRNGSGSIVTLASTAGIQAADGLAPYVSSKFAVRGLSRVAALELARSGIRVNTVLPGPVDTAMNQPGGWWKDVDLRPMMAKGNPLGRIADPREIAELIAFLVSDASSFSTGNDYAADGGQLAGVFVPPRPVAS
jgi:3alpha(or 20beta)-hydroxysteroid dehydrogenase